MSDTTIRPARATGTSGAALVVAICSCATFSDGYDLQALGLAVPGMAAAMHVTPPAFTLATSTSLIGMALGAIFLTPLADRYGSERIIATMLALIGVSTIGVALSGSPGQVAAWRFLSGLGLGAVVPAAITLASSRAPVARRALLTTLTVSFTGIGAFVAGMLAPVIEAAWGWRGLFVVGSVMPLVVAGATQLLPRPARAQAARAAPAAVDRKGPGGVGVLFSTPHRSLTIVVWALFWLNLLVNYSLISWLPSLLIRAGWTTTDAAHTTGLLALGGIVGGLVISALADRGRAIATLTTAYLLAAAALAVFASAPVDRHLWTALIVAVGLTAFGAQIAISAVVAVRYPVSIRATAIGWSSGFGRVGAFVGPVVVARLMEGSVPSSTILALLLVPMLICAAAVATLPRDPAHGV